MPNVTGERLDVAKSDIEHAGFKNDVDVVGGGTFGVLVESNWVVCEQSPAAGTNLAGTPRLVVDRSCDNGTATPSESSQEPTDQASESPPPSETPTLSATAEPQNLVLTVRNNEDLAALLSSHNSTGKAVRKFAKTYAGRTIRFNGSIDLVAPHENYKTIFDILVSSHNYSETSSWGPTFKFGEVQIANSKAFRNYGSDYVRVGNNVVIEATIDHYDASHGIFYLDPVSVRLR